jgi:Integrase core domain
MQHGPRFLNYTTDWGATAPAPQGRRRKHHSYAIGPDKRRRCRCHLPEHVTATSRPGFPPNIAKSMGPRAFDAKPGVGFDLLYAFVIIRLDRRDLVWINVTAHPTAEWVARQITEAFPWDEAPHYLIRDRDRIYGSVVARRLRAMGIRDKPTASASPWQNGFVERLIGSIRRECVDHIIVLGEMHLRRVLKSYADYYNRAS